MELGRTKKRAIFLLCSVALAMFAESATAKPAHRQRVAQVAAQAQNTSAAVDDRYANIEAQPVGREAGRSRVPNRRQVRQEQVRAETTPSVAGFGSSSLVSEARKYLGTNPTGRGSLWCGAFMDLVLKRTGYAGGGNLASAYARYGSRVGGPQVGAIAVIRRGGGGHVGVVAGVDPNGNPIVISGNHNNTVAESVYPRSRIVAYVMPSS